MALNDDIAVLARQPLLSLMDKDALRLLAFAAESRVIGAGDVLFRRDEPATGAFLILSGKIAISAEDDGRTAAAVLGQGTLIGEMALFAALQRPVTAIAREPTLVMHISRSVMRRVLTESPQSALAISDAIAQRLRGLNAELSQVADALDSIDRR